MATQPWAIMTVLIGTAIGSCGPIFLKKASSGIHRNLKTIITNKHLWMGIAAYAISTAIFIPSLKGGDLSVLYPLVATVYIWVSLLSVKYLNEKMNSLKWIGIALIMCGVMFLGFSA